MSHLRADQQFYRPVKRAEILTGAVLKLIDEQPWLFPMRIYIRDSAPALSSAVLIAADELLRIQEKARGHTRRGLYREQAACLAEQIDWSRNQVAEAFARAQQETPLEDPHLLPRLFEAKIKAISAPEPDPSKCMIC